MSFPQGKTHVSHQPGQVAPWRAARPGGRENARSEAAHTRVLFYYFMIPQLEARVINPTPRYLVCVVLTG